MTTQMPPVVGIDAQPARLIVCALMWASPAQVLEALELLELDDFTTPHREILETIALLAEDGRTGAGAVQGELLRLGQLHGPVRREIETAPLSGGVVEGIRDYATAHTAAAFRDRCGAYGFAVATASESASEGELWSSIIAGGRELRRLAARLEQLRGGAL